MSLIGVYHGLPGPLQSFAAAMRGVYLRRWRYGPDSDRLTEEVLARDRWTPGEWAAWQEELLARVLHRAATRVPYYRDHWSERRRRGDRAAWDVLANWPILEKDPLRASPGAFVADDCDTARMFHEHTSGTTGTALDLWWSRKTVRTWYAMFEARWRRWYGVSRHDRWAIIGGQLVTPIGRQAPPFWVWNPALRQLYLSAYHIAPRFVPHYLDAMRRYRVRYLFAYPSAAYALAVAANPAAARALELEVVIANAEPVLDHQREQIEAVFGCPVRQTYGMSEIVVAASECEAGNLHLWPDAGIVEVMCGDTTAPGATTGDLVCTGLVNEDMPLIRYRVGDRAALGESREPCGCGRTLPRLGALDGRSDDVLYTPDGRAVGRMDPVFKSRAPILEAQIVQEALDRIRLIVVPAPEYTAAAGAELAERIRDRLGRVTVQLETVEAIPRTSNGKLRAVVCRIPAAQRRAMQSSAMRSE